MAINRAPFNALVDDDGSGTKGSPWNKSAIASVILDPTDAAIAAAIAGVPIPPSGPLTLVGSGSGQDTTATPFAFTYVAIPQLTMADRVIVSAVAVYGGGVVPVVLDLALYDPATTAISVAVTLTGAAGAGDLIPNNVGIFSVDLRPLPPGPVNMQSIGYGAITAGLDQSRGFPFACLSSVNLLSAGSGFLYFRHGGVSASGTLYWSWSVHLLKG